MAEELSESSVVANNGFQLWVLNGLLYGESGDLQTDDVGDQDGILFAQVLDYHEHELKLAGGGLVLAEHLLDLIHCFQDYHLHHPFRIGSQRDEYVIDPTLEVQGVRRNVLSGELEHREVLTNQFAVHSLVLLLEYVGLLLGDVGRGHRVEVLFMEPVRFELGIADIEVREGSQYSLEALFGTALDCHCQSGQQRYVLSGRELILQGFNLTNQIGHVYGLIVGGVDGRRSFGKHV